MIKQRHHILRSFAFSCVGLFAFLFPLDMKGQGTISETEILYQKLEHFYDTGGNADSAKLWMDELAGLAKSSANSLAKAHLHRFQGEEHLVDFQTDSALADFTAARRLYQPQASAYQVQRLCLSLADVQFEMGNYQACDSLLNGVKAYAQKNSFPFLFGKVAYIQGGVFSRQGNCQASVDAMDEASNWFAQSGHQKWQSMARAEAAACLVDLGRFEESIARYLESARYYEEQGEWRNVGIRYINIGTVFYEMGRYEDAIDYGKRAHKALPASFQYGQAHAYNLLGISYQELAALDSAVKYFSKILDIEKNGALQNDYLLAIVLSNLAESMNGMGQSREALEYVNRGLNIVDVSSDLLTYSRLKIIHGNILFDLGEWSQGISVMQAGIETAEREGYTAVLNPGYKKLATLYASRGSYELAYQYHQLHKVIDDSLAGVEKFQAVARLETEFETEKKEHEIERLSQNERIQALELSRKNTLLYGVSIGLLLVVVVFAVLFQQRKLRSKKKSVELEQRLLRAQMNPHFIFNTMVSLRNALFEKSTQETAQYLTQFSKLMRQILEHSRQEFISLEEEIETLENYCALQQFRFNDSFQYTIEIDESVDPEEILIPPMFAQPFIENALEHGIDHAAKKGILTVKFSQEDDHTLKLNIEDNGKGIEVTQKIKDKEGSDHKSLALSITKERLANFGLAGSLVLQQILDEQQRVAGTRVIMSLPYQID